jgi:hypothetical protein
LGKESSQDIKRAKFGGGIKMKENHIYEVGMMTDNKKIKAPNAKAAALFYGLNTGGNMQLGAVVYSEDGEEVNGEDRMPFAEYQFDFTMSDEKIEKMKAELLLLKPMLKECRFME